MTNSEARKRAAERAQDAAQAAEDARTQENKSDMDFGSTGLLSEGERHFFLQSGVSAQHVEKLIAAKLEELRAKESVTYCALLNARREVDHWRETVAALHGLAVNGDVGISLVPPDGPQTQWWWSQKLRRMDSAWRRTIRRVIEDGA